MIREAIRPRFQINCHLHHEEVLERLSTLKEDKEISYKKIFNRVKISPKKDNREYWSPVLTITVEPDDSGSSETIIRCLIGPKESVWLMFLFTYASAGLILMFGGIMSLSEMSLGIYSLYLLSIPLSLGMIGATFFAAKFGQKKGQGQMNCLITKFMSKFELEESEKNKHLRT